MTRFYKFAAAASTLALLTAGVVHAQETTGGIKGFVTNEQGAPVAGAKVTVVHVPTGVTVVTKTDATGFYSADQLRIGGPYKVTVDASGATATTDVPFVSIGAPVEGDLSVKAAATTEVVVKGKRRDVVAGRTRVSQEEIQTYPSLNRDIRDYALKSPSAWADPTNNGAMSIAGMNNRSNAILVDGVRQGDDFGLNANGLPTNRSPISVDSVEAVSVDTAPYDVVYSYFQGGVINYVTKSGGNDFHGGLFYDKTGNDLRGKSFITPDGVTRPVTGNFSEKTIGGNFSGPLIKDKAWFFVLYEKFEGTKPNQYGPSGSNAPQTVPGVTQAQADLIRSDVKSLYNYDPLGVATAIPYTDTKKQLKVDYQITDNQRAVFAIENTQSGSVNEVGDSNNTTTGALSLASKFYTLETDLKVYKAQLISHWTDNFSTEFNASRKEVVNISNPEAGSDFAQFKVCVNTAAFAANCNATTATGSAASIFLGPDISRQENVLRNNNTHFDLRAHYRWGNHNFLVGAEHERIDVYNAFVQNSTAAYTFFSVAALEAKKADSVTYSNAADNIKADGAAQFSYSTNTLYAEDTWRVTPRLTLTYGIRWDGYTSATTPTANQTFANNYGFTNAKGLDGLHSFQPRFDFNWHPAFDNGLTVYGGVGIFQGGSPNVWISNSYTNTGRLLGTVTCNRIAGTDNASCNNGVSTTTVAGVLNNIDGFKVPAAIQALNTQSANAGTGNTNAISPNFKMPSVAKASIGAQQIFDLGRFGDGYRLTGEYTMTHFIAAPYWQDLYQQLALSGTAPDGRPEYFGTVNGGTKANHTDVVLTTAQAGEARMLSVELYKAFHSSWYNGFSFDAAINYEHSTDQNSGTSSVATSSYKQSTWSDPNHPGVAISDYQVDKIGKLTLAYDHKFFGNNRTSFVLYTQFRTGQRYSFTFQDPITGSGAATGMYGLNSTYTTSNVELFYVPKTDGSGNVTATSDPLITYKPGFDMAGFNTFLKQTGLIKYAGQISPRNGFKSPDNLFSNLRIMQEIPAVNPRFGKLELYMDVNNVGNLINKHWGAEGQYGFPYNRLAVNATNCQAAAQKANATTCSAGVGNFYQYNSLATTPITYDPTSVYQIKFGIDYKF